MKDFDKIENKIIETADLVLKKNSYEIPLSFDKLGDNIPFKSFEEFKYELNSGNIFIKKFNLGLSPIVVKLFSNKIDITKFYFYLTMLYLSPFISIILSFKYSFWWLLGVLFFPVIFLKLKKRLYINFLYYIASNSEIAFSFFFFLKEISLNDFKTTYYWKKND